MGQVSTLPNVAILGAADIQDRFGLSRFINVEKVKTRKISISKLFLLKIRTKTPT